MQGKKRLMEFLHRSLERPNVVEIAVTLLLLCLAIIAFSDTGLNIIYFFVLSFGMMGIGAIWGARAIFHLVRHVIRTEDRKLALRRIAAWSVLPVICVLMAGMVIEHHTLLKVRLRLSESAMSDFVQNVPPGTDEASSEKKQWVGLFHVSEVQRLDGCVRLITSTDIFDDAGLVYCPDGEPPVIEEDYYRHLYGPWWRWERSW